MLKMVLLVYVAITFIVTGSLLITARWLLRNPSEWKRLTRNYKCIIFLIIIQIFLLVGIPVYSHLQRTTIFTRPSRLLNEIIDKVYTNLYSNWTEVSDSIIAEDYKFRNYEVSEPPVFNINDRHKIFFADFGSNSDCFIRGTDLVKTQQANDGECHCRKNYYGKDCGIPEAAWFSLYAMIYPFTNLIQRSVPRRVINGLPVNHEFAMFEARMHELYKVMDVFLVAESNYSSHGDPKELYFLKKFKEGYMANFQDKLVYVKLDYFSDKAKSDGWYADSYLRTYMGIKGLPLIKGLRDDDLFILSDADELPSEEMITFLKVYDGYSEPVSFGMRWNVYNFYWRVADYTFQKPIGKLTTVSAVASIGFVQKVLSNDVFKIRNISSWLQPEIDEHMKKYVSDGHLVKEWVAGTEGHYAGWHCSWCFSPEKIVQKLESAQADDKPRWGDYPQKKNLTYIKSLISEGRWFDDKGTFMSVSDPHERFYAPRYLLEHPDEYRSILFHPNHSLNLGQEWKPP